MKPRIAALALPLAVVLTPYAAHATPGFLIDFENPWDYANGDIAGYYAGGAAADGTTGANLGVSFVNVSGLSNDASFTYYTGAPTQRGVAYAHTFSAGETAFMNVAAGVTNALSFWYASPSAIVDAVRAYSGLDGAGTLLGTLSLAADSGAGYDAWTQVRFAFGGVARSFDFTNTTNIAALDDIGAAAVPEPQVPVLLMVGAAAALCLRGRKRS